jgi:hypothetical protein
MIVFGREISDVADLINWAPLTPPWRVEDLACWVTQETGRTVKFQAWPEVVDSGRVGCTLLIRTATELRIFYDSDRSPAHQRQQAGHEFAHIMADHLGFEVADGVRIGGAPKSLLGSLGMSTLEYVLGTSTAAVAADELDRRSRRPSQRHPYFSEKQEIEAELLGTKLAVCMRGNHRAWGATSIWQGDAFVESLRQ